VTSVLLIYNFKCGFVTVSDKTVFKVIFFKIIIRDLTTSIS